MDFTSGKTLLSLCSAENVSISEAMLRREISLGEISREEILEKLNASIAIMKNSTREPLADPAASAGKLLNGQAHAAWKYVFEDKKTALCGTSLSKAVAYAMAVLETNASMGLIVAAPTAGSAGVIPATLLAICEDYGFPESAITEGLLNASAIGYIIMRNASVAGAEAGCQAEVGSASAMAASAAVQLFGGSPRQSLTAASIALSNLLGLVCDPIAGLVEVPCQSRNAIGAANAFVSAQLALAGSSFPIPFDEMVEATYKTGQSLPSELRETALGGCAATPTGCALCSKLT